MTETTTTVDEAIRTALSHRRDKALLELREIARVLDGLGDNDARRHAQDALHHKIDLALGNGATLAQVADVLHGGANPDAVHVAHTDLVRLRMLIGEVAGSAGRVRVGVDPGLAELVDALATVLAANRELFDELIDDRAAHQQLKNEVAAVRRVLGVATD